MRCVLSIVVLVIMLFSGLPLQAQECQPKQPEVVVKVFTLQHADADHMVEVIDGLFQTQESSPASPSVKTSRAPEDGPLVRLTTKADPRTNSIVASGPPGDLQVIEDLLLRLDEKEPLTRGTTVYKLKNAPAEDVAQAINVWLTKRAIMQSEGPSQTTPKQAVVVPEIVSNSLIVSTSLDDEEAKELDAVIRALDVRPDMVHIAVVIKQTKDGKETILSKPTIVTLDNLQGRVTVGTEQDSITVELTPRVFRDQE